MIKKSTKIDLFVTFFKLSGLMLLFLCSFFQPVHSFSIGGAVGGMVGGALITGSISIDPLDSGASDPHNSSGVSEDQEITITCNYNKATLEAMWVASALASHTPGCITPPYGVPPFPTSDITYSWSIVQPDGSEYPIQPNPNSGSSNTVTFTFDTPSNPEAYTINCQVDHECKLKGCETIIIVDVPVPKPFTENESASGTISTTIIVNDHTAPGSSDPYSGVNNPSTTVSGLKSAYLGWTCENLSTRNPSDFTSDGCIEVKVTDNNPAWPPPSGWEDRAFVKLYYQVGPREGQEKWIDQDGDGLAETFERYFHKLMFPEDQSIVPPPYSDDGSYGGTVQAAPRSDCFIYGSDNSFSWTPFNSPIPLRSNPAAPASPSFGENWGQQTGDHIFTMTQNIYPRGDWKTVNGGGQNVDGWPAPGEDVDFFWVGPLDFEFVDPDGGWSNLCMTTTWKLDTRKIVLPHFFAANDSTYNGVLKVFIHICDGSGNTIAANYGDAKIAQDTNGAIFLSEIQMEDNDPPWVNLKIKNTQSNVVHQYGMPHNTKVRWCNMDDFWEADDDYHWDEDSNEPNCCVVVTGHELVEDVRFLFKPFYMDNVNRCWPNFNDPLSYGIDQLKNNGGLVEPESFEIIIHDPLDPEGDGNGNVVFQFADVGAYVSHTFRAATPPDNPEYYWIQYHVRDGSDHPGADGQPGNVRGMKIILPVKGTSSTIESLQSSSE